MRYAIAAALLLIPAVAHAKTGMSGETIGQIVVAIITVAGGGGLLYRRHTHQQGAEGREELSTRAQVAIARDNDEKVLRERIEGYQSEVAGLRGDLLAAAERAASAELKAQAAVDEVGRLRELLQHHQHRADRREDQAAMLAAVEQLQHQLALALADIARRAGDHRADR